MYRSKTPCQDTVSTNSNTPPRATKVLQVAIALAAIALLTKKKWLEWAMFAMGGLGVLIGALAALHI